MPSTYSGGYLIAPTTIMPMSPGDRHTGSLEDPVSATTLRAVNAIQATPWRINRWLLRVAEDCYDAGIPVAGLSSQETAPERVERLPDDVWATMDDAARKAWSGHLRRSWDAYTSHVGRSQATLDALQVADRLQEHPAIWFPHRLDFRHRIYPVATQGPQPQGNDLSKALLEFAEGVPLGEDGLFWLCVRAANCAGQDKLPMVERVEWTLERREELAHYARNPLENIGWADVDEPWQFLATCRELDAALNSASRLPESYRSRLPVSLDGSCNGLQHLSAMGLDPVGAAATNLQDGPRRDIYTDVAEFVEKRVAVDAEVGVPAALLWAGRVNRKVVKRAVMTTPYGVTSAGIRMQLLNDGHVPVSEAPMATAHYLGECLGEALGHTLRGGKAIMAWLQETAGALARAGYPMDWTNPAGSLCRQAYEVPHVVRVVTLVGTMQGLTGTPGGALDIRKQAAGAAPNFVHSFDAAHAAMTTVAAHDEGIRSFAMIHDSYGTHAANATRMARLLRQTFADIYREDWLATSCAGFESYANGVRLTPPPPRGDFDILRVLDSEFFFS